MISTQDLRGFGKEYGFSWEVVGNETCQAGHRKKYDV